MYAHVNHKSNVTIIIATRRIYIVELTWAGAFSGVSQGVRHWVGMRIPTSSWLSATLLEVPSQN